MNLKGWFSKNEKNVFPNVYNDFEIGENIIFNNGGIKHKAIIVDIKDTILTIDYGEDFIDVDIKYIKKIK